MSIGGSIGSSLGLGGGSSIGQSAGKLAKKIPRQSKPRPAPQQYNPPPIQSTSSGRYSPPSAPPSSGGGGGGSVPQIKPKPEPPGIWSHLRGDTTYQQQLRDLNRTLSSFKADAGRRKGVLQGENKTSLRALGKQRGMDLEDLEADFGARGLLKSGLYADALSDYEGEYSERVTDLNTQLRRALSQLNQERRQQSSKYKLSRQEAREAAVDRRAAKYDL